MSLRYYVYVSDSKVDMLLPQVDPAFGRKRDTEVGMSLKIVSAKRKVETPSSQRIARLERVVRYLDDFADVGTVDDPGQYFRGRLTMRWGPAPGQPTSVYFGGRTDRTIVGLGGSSGHVVGTPAQVAPTGPAFSPSTVPGIVSGLAAALAADGEEVPEGALAATHLATRQLRGDGQEVEFVAKRLRHGPSPYPELDPRPGMTVLLGSPIFVALAD